MQSEISVYFEQTFQSFFSQRLQEFVQRRSQSEPHLMHALTELERQMDDLFKQHIPRKTYLNALMAIIDRFCRALWVGQETLGKTELEVKLYLLIFSVWVEDEIQALEGSELAATAREAELVKTISYFRLVCQLDAEFAFELFFQQLFGHIRQGANNFRQILLRIFKKCQVEKASFLSLLKPSCPAKKDQKSKLEECQSEHNTLNTEAPRKKQKRKDKNVIRLKRQVQSPINCRSQVTTQSNFSAWRFTSMPKANESSGRTLYMAHPMKYIKKQKDKMKKVYHYVEISGEQME